MSNKNEVFEYLIDQLRQQLPVVDVMGEIKRWSIDRSIAGRGNYTDEENAIIDAYIGLGRNPYKQQCEDLAREVQSLKNQLRDASALVAELQKELEQAKSWYNRMMDSAEKGKAFVQVIRPSLSDAPEQSGCRKNDTEECYHNWRFVGGKSPAVCINCGVTKSSECEHEWQFYGVGFPCMCIKCGLKK